MEIFSRRKSFQPGYLYLLYLQNPLNVSQMCVPMYFRNLTMKGDEE